MYKENVYKEMYYKKYALLKEIQSLLDLLEDLSSDVDVDEEDEGRCRSRRKRCRRNSGVGDRSRIGDFRFFSRFLLERSEEVDLDEDEVEDEEEDEEDLDRDDDRCRCLLGIGGRLQDISNCSNSLIN